jgi:hypothetical protein
MEKAEHLPKYENHRCSILWSGGTDIAKHPKIGFMIQHLRHSSTEVKDTFIGLAPLQSGSAQAETHEILRQLVKLKPKKGFWSLREWMEPP